MKIWNKIPSFSDDLPIVYIVPGEKVEGKWGKKISGEALDMAVHVDKFKISLPVLDDKANYVLLVDQFEGITAGEINRQLWDQGITDINLLTADKEWPEMEAVVVDEGDEKAKPLESLTMEELVKKARALQHPVGGTKEDLIARIRSGVFDMPGHVYNTATGRWMKASSAAAKAIASEKAMREAIEPQKFFPLPYESYNWRDPARLEDGWVLPNSREFPSFIRKWLAKGLKKGSGGGSGGGVAGGGGAAGVGGGKEEMLHSTPGDEEGDELFEHQRIVKRYLHPSTPYRGLLVYHGLGGGKTRTAIEVAEDFRACGYHIIIFTPASLQANFRQEIRLWGRSDLRAGPSYSMTSAQLMEYNAKVDKWYHFINYNGVPIKRLRELGIYYDAKTNIYYPPKNCLIIMEEVHNLIHNMNSETSEKGKLMLEILRRADNCKFLAMSGTPMIDSPIELVILFNLLRGPMLDRTGNRLSFFPQDEEIFRSHFVSSTPQGDLSMNSSKIGQFKRRIMGMVSYLPGGVEKVKRSLYPEILPKDAPELVLCPMEEHQLQVYTDLRAIEEAKDRMSRSRRIDNEMDNMKPTFRIQSRKAGNYVFPPGIPRPTKGYVLSDEAIRRFSLAPKIVFDFSQWKEKQMKAMMRVVTSSRGTAAVNNPDELGDEDREDWLEIATQINQSRSPTEMIRYLEQFLAMRLAALQRYTDWLATLQDLMSGDVEGWASYTLSTRRGTMTEAEAIEYALGRLRDEKTHFDPKNLKHYSHKMLKMWQDLWSSPKPALVYSNFKTLEGVGIFAILLEHMGYKRFDMREWAHAEDPSHIPDAPRYALFTGDTGGSSAVDERSYILQVFNHPSNQVGMPVKGWPTDPKVGVSGNRGGKIQIILGTSAVAEGLNIFGIRLVQAMEPHWNRVRIDQVMGRARRPKSHTHLSVEERTVQAKMYMSVSPKMMDDIVKWRKEMADGTINHIEFSERTRDMTDLYIDNVAVRKKHLADQLLKLVQEASIDCHINMEGGRCMDFRESDYGRMSYYPNYLEDMIDGDYMLSAGEKYVPFKPPGTDTRFYNVDGTAKFYYRQSDADDRKTRIQLFTKDGGGHYVKTKYLFEITPSGGVKLSRAD